MQAQNLLDGQCAQPSHRGEVDEDVEEKPQNGESKTYTIIIAFAQELWNRKNLAVEHHGQKEFTDDNQGHCGHHFVGSNGNAVAEARARHADKLLGRDVGGNQRGSHGPPCQCVAGKEIVVCTLFFSILVAAEEQTKAYQQHKVTYKDKHIDGLEAR